MPKTHNCRKKFTKKSLGEHNLVSHIVDSKTVYCICGNKIRLDKEWDPDFLIQHAKNNRCQEARKGRQAITKFFPVNDTKNTKKPCKGLKNDKIANYLEHVGMLVGQTDINIQLNTQLITLHSEIWDWYKFLTEENSIKTLTQCIN